VRAAQEVLPALLIIAAGAWIVGRFLPRARVPVRWIAVAGVLSALIVVRDRFRYEYYDAAQRWRAYDVHTIDSRWTASWPIWQRFDGDAPFVLAVSAGWDGIGHNWYRYPLLGRRLQNRLIYVPISRDGSFFDYGLQPDSFPPTSCAAWRDRLLASQSEYLVLLPPLPPETAWAESNPASFQLEMDLGHGFARAYRIVRNTDVSGGKCD